MHEQNEKFNKEIKTVKKNEIEILELKTELKNSIENFKSRLNHAEERISKLKNRSFEINQLEEYNSLNVYLSNSYVDS